MRPDEAVMRALEEEGLKDCVDVEKLVKLMMDGAPIQVHSLAGGNPVW